MQGFNMGRYVPPDQEGVMTGNQLHGRRAGATVRFEMPYAVWCLTCAPQTLIGQGVRFNAAKTRDGHYLTTPVWRFRFRHADCGGTIEMRTDPRNTAYEVVSGARARIYGPADEPPAAPVALAVCAGPDGQPRVLTAAERERSRQDAIASLEKTIADRDCMRGAVDHITELASASARCWADPGAQNRRLRAAFRHRVRRPAERAAAADAALRTRLALPPALQLLPAHPDDARRAALVDFRPLAPDHIAAVALDVRVLAKPLFPAPSPSPSALVAALPRLRADRVAARCRADLIAEIVANSRAARDPFLQNSRLSSSLAIKRRKLVARTQLTHPPSPPPSPPPPPLPLLSPPPPPPYLKSPGLGTSEESSDGGGLVDYDSN